jgi:hypothetical protein
MRLPDNFPSVLRTFAEHGYTAKSGNTARLELAVTGTAAGKTGGVIVWKREPSEADKRELEQIIAAQMNVRRGPDVNPQPEKVANWLRDNLKA